MPPRAKTQPAVSAVSKASTVRLETTIASTRPAAGGDADEPDIGKISLRQTAEDADDGSEELNNLNTNLTTRM